MECDDWFSTDLEASVMNARSVQKSKNIPGWHCEHNLISWHHHYVNKEGADVTCFGIRLGGELRADESRQGEGDANA